MPAVAVLKAGDQVPVIGALLVDDVGNADGTVAANAQRPYLRKGWCDQRSDHYIHGPLCLRTAPAAG